MSPPPYAALRVLEPGPLTTVQDRGRPGLAHLGVGRSGAADQGSYRLANRLVGNDEGDAVLEVTLGGLAVRAEADLILALAGAPCAVRVDGRSHAANAPIGIGSGKELILEPPPSGLRSYLAVRGGIRVPEILGSCSTDTLSGIGPGIIKKGDVLPIGRPYGPQPTLDLAPVEAPSEDDLTLAVRLGPRDEWFTDDAIGEFLAARFEVTAESNRVGMRLHGPALERARAGELPSEGMVLGAVQVTPDGQPTLFLADHPVTGGYPVVAVVAAEDLDRAAQARPGQHLRFRLMSTR